jgi:hypothetical protein
MVPVIVAIFAADSVVGGGGDCGGCNRLPSHDPQTTSAAY